MTMPLRSEASPAVGSDSEVVYSLPSRFHSPLGVCQLILKRLLDVIGAAVGLVVLAPILWIIALLFAAPWLDFAGMWLTKLVSPRFAIVTLAGGWAMALGYVIVAALATYQMWWRKT